MSGVDRHAPGGSFSAAHLPRGGPHQFIGSVCVPMKQAPLQCRALTMQPSTDENAEICSVSLSASLGIHPMVVRDSFRVLDLCLRY